MESNNVMIDGEASYNKADARPLLELWIVVDKLGGVSKSSNEDHARALAVCHDNDYPSLSPHRAVRMVEAP